jgi:hypothetical protein
VDCLGTKFGWWAWQFWGISVPRIVQFTVKLDPGTVSPRLVPGSFGSGKKHIPPRARGPTVGDSSKYKNNRPRGFVATEANGPHARRSARLGGFARAPA